MHQLTLRILEFLNDRRLVVYPALILIGVYSVVLIPISSPPTASSLNPWLSFFGFIFLFKLVATNRFSLALLSTALAAIVTSYSVILYPSLPPFSAGLCFSVYFYCLMSGAIKRSRDPSKSTLTEFMLGLLPVLFAAPCIALGATALGMDDPFMGIPLAAVWILMLVSGGIMVMIVTPALIADFFIPRHYPLLVRPTFFTLVSALGVYLGINGAPLLGTLLIFYGLYKVGELRFSEKAKGIVNRVFSRIFAVILCFYLARGTLFQSSEIVDLSLFISSLAFLLVWLLFGGGILWIYRPILKFLLAYRILPIGGLVVCTFLWGGATFVCDEVTVFQALVAWTGLTTAVIGLALFMKSGREIIILLISGLFPLFVNQLVYPTAPSDSLLFVVFLALICASIQLLDLRQFVQAEKSIPDVRKHTVKQAGDELKSAVLPFAIAFGSLFLFEFSLGEDILEISLWTWLAIGLNLWIVPVLFAWSRELEMRKQDVMKDVYRTRQEKTS